MQTSPDISELVNRIAGLAPAPVHLPRLSVLLRDPNTNVGEIEDVIRCDPDLTTSLLRWANSVSFRGRQPVTAVEEAVLRMGFDAVLEAVMLLITKDIYALPPEAETHLNGLWSHCLLTAILTRELARKHEGLGSVGFTAGLLHDIGKVLLIKAVPERYSRILEGAQKRRRPCAEEELRALKHTHASLGAEVLARWNLPETIVSAIWFHHHPRAGEAKNPLTTCIELADVLAYAAGCGLRGHYIYHTDTRPLLKVLGFTPREAGEILQHALEELEHSVHFAPR